jgi:putative sugar O-methyltransferase
MNYQEYINELLLRAKAQNELYQATSFWDTAIDPMLSDLAEQGIENFRQWQSALTYFVPTYGSPGNSLSLELMSKLNNLIMDAETSKQQQALKKFITGEYQAFSDYRVVTAILKRNAPWLLENANESEVGKPIEQFIFDNNRYSRSYLNYLLGLAALSEFCDLKSITNVLEIGGGFGSLGEILFGNFDRETTKYCNLDIPPTCSISEYYLKQVTSLDVLGAFDDREVDFASNDWSLAVRPNWDIEKVTGNIDLFVNYISFQEMEPNVVANYLRHVLRLQPKWILLRHIREGKQKLSPSNPVGVRQPTTPDIYTELLPGYSKLLSDSSIFGFVTPDNFHSEVIIYANEH